MCTSFAMKTNDFYFGRTMDLDYELNTSVVITPRNYPFRFRRCNPLQQHYAMIGMAHVIDNYPLYAEAANERGLCIAGLNFPDNAYYSSEDDPEKSNISPFELTLWLLGQCATVKEAKTLLASTNLVNIPFSKQLPLTPLHWHIADQNKTEDRKSVV